MYYPQHTGPLSLRAAIANIHRDPAWWRTVLLGGAFALTIIGVPWAVGLVVQSYDNVRRGYPTPLPPSDGITRYIIGFLALMIDFAFFVLPLILVGVVLLCGIFALTISNSTARFSTPALALGGLLGLYWLLLFALSIVPASRIIYATTGRVEEAMSMFTIRAATEPLVRGELVRARLRSLPAYVPAVVLGGLCWLVAVSALPGALFGTLLLLWFALSALLYAHLVTAQLYATIANSMRLSS